MQIKLQYWPRRLSMVVMGFAILGLMAYFPGLMILGSWGENYIPMAPTTALCFIVLAAVLIMFNSKLFSTRSTTLYLVLLLGLSLFGLLNLAEYFTGVNLTFEKKLIPTPGTLHGIPLARMSPATGGLFFLSGLSLFLFILSDRFPKRHQLLKNSGCLLNLLVLLTGFIFTLAYFYGTPLLYGYDSTIPMALTTAVAFLLISVSTFLTEKESILFYVLSDSTTRAYLLRFILPLTIFSVLLGGILVQWSTQIAALNPAFLSAAVTVAVTLLSALAATVISHHLGREIDSAKANLKEANEALLKNETHLRTLIETIPDLVWLKDPDGTYLSCNRRFESFFGAPAEAIIGRSDYDFMEKDLADFFRTKDKEAIKAGKPTINEEEITFAEDGHHEILETIKTPMIGNDGSLVGVLGISRNITERKQMAKELIEKEEMMLAQSRQAAMGEMIAMIAHQWRQPITVIAMAVNNIRLSLELERNVSHDELKRLTDTVTKQTQHLSKTIDDFRNFFKPDRIKEKGSVHNTVEESVNIIGKSLENNNIHLKIVNSCKNETQTYSRELLQVILNIVHNAKDILTEKMPQNPFITISCHDDADTTTIRIADNGGGIPDNIIKRIGEPYVSSKTASGTGLGLYMSKIIVEKHLHGRFSWENTQEGACFSIVLPQTMTDLTS